MSKHQEFKEGQIVVYNEKPATVYRIDGDNIIICVYNKKDINVQMIVVNKDSLSEYICKAKNKPCDYTGICSLSIDITCGLCNMAYKRKLHLQKSNESI